MCRCGASAEGQYRESRKDPKAHCLPSGRWTLGMIRSIPPDQMLVRCTNMIRFTVRRMKKHGMLDGNLHISIDKHLMPRYDKNPDMTNLVPVTSQLRRHRWVSRRSWQTGWITDCPGLG